jgi:hypothetical protein
MPRPRRPSVLPGVRSYLVFQKYSFTDPRLIAHWRTTWPAWRRAVRPIGAAAWWLGAVVGVVFDHGHPEYARIIIYVVFAVVVTCMAIGISSYRNAGGERGLQRRFTQTLDSGRSVPITGPSTW